MPKNVPQNRTPGFVVLRRLDSGLWEALGEVERRRGLTGREARTQAILEATHGRARSGEAYAAVPRSEWNLARDWAYEPTQRRRTGRG